LDVFNPDPVKLARSPAECYLHKTIATSDGQTIRVETTSEYHAASQVLHFDLFYLRDGELIRTKQVNMRCYFPEELLALCRFNSLEIVGRFGDYTENLFSSKSPKQILMCRNSGT
jgi:hypothetical protein